MPSTSLTAGPWTCTDRDYHADRQCVNSSSLEVFRASRALYHGQYVSGTIARREPSDAMALGTAVHAMLLFPRSWHDLIAVKPDIDGRTKEGKERNAMFLEQYGQGSHCIIKADAFETAERIVAALQQHETVSALLRSPSSLREQAIRWQDPETDLWCKAKPDMIVGLADGAVCLDLKTSSDPLPAQFGRSVANFGYHRQAAFYLSGLRTLQPQSTYRFLHAVVGNEEPFDVVVYELDKDALALAERQRSEALIQLAECHRTDEWSTPGTIGIQPLSLPRWALELES